MYTCPSYALALTTHKYKSRWWCMSISACRSLHTSHHFTSHHARLTLSLCVCVCVWLCVHRTRIYIVDGMKEQGQLADNTSGRNSAATLSASKPKKGKDRKLNQAKLELANANRQLIQTRFKSTLIVRYRHPSLLPLPDGGIPLSLSICVDNGVTHCVCARSRTRMCENDMHICTSSMLSCCNMHAYSSFLEQHDQC